MSVLRNKTRQPRRQRTYLRADARRAQILDVAKRVFVRRGYHVANVADICKEARIGRGTLYQYFDNKRAVMLALMEDLAARVGRVLDERQALGPVPGASKAPIEMIVSFCKRRLREVLDAVFVDETTLRLILRDARGLDGAVDQVIATIDQLVLRAMERDIKIAQELRLIRRGNPRLIARYLLGGVEKMVLTALANDEPVDLGVIVDMAVDIELFGILHEEVRR
jgi:AcrR family transcriptional regulator